MDLVVWRAEDIEEEVKEELKEDKILATWLIGQKNTMVEKVVNDFHICILLLDGNYDEMFQWCLQEGISIPRILDLPRYRLYKKLEKRYRDLQRYKMLTFSDVYFLLKQVAYSHENNNIVMQLCKEYFVRCLKQMDVEEFWQGAVKPGEG